MSLRAAAEEAVGAPRESPGRREGEQVVRLCETEEEGDDGDGGSSDRRSMACERDADPIVRTVSAIFSASTAEEVYESIVEVAGEALGAVTAALVLRGDDTNPVGLVRASGYTSAASTRLSSAVAEDEGHFPGLDAATEARVFVVSTPEELRRRYPLFAECVTTRCDRCACAPLVVAGRLLGSVAFTFDAAVDGEDEVERPLLLSLVARCGGDAVERMRALDAERSRLSHIEADASRLAAFNRATRRFSEASSSLAPLLATIAEQLALEGGGSCAAALFGNGEVPRMSVVYPPSDGIAELAGALAAGSLPRGLRNSAHLVLPLMARREQIGVVCVAREARSAFTDEERAFVTELAERAALVVERALLYESTRLARVRAELLYGLARLVIAAESTADVLEPSLDAVGRSVNANRAAILLCDSDGVMRFKAWRGLSEGYRAAVEGHSPWPRDARCPEPVIVRDVRESPSVAGLLSVLESENIRALSFIPLVADGRILGKFMLYFDEPRELSSQERDITIAIANHVAAAVARLDAVAELRQTVHFNEMFTAILGHDLRNPLGAIMTAAQLAMKRFDDERLHKPLGRIVKSGQRMARMIDQLLDFTRVRVGDGLPLSTQALDVLPLLRRVIQEAGDTPPGASIALESAGDTIGDWDPERLGQVFSNLVGNAVHHGAPGMPPRVRVDGTQASLVHVEVVSRGTIPRDLAAKLFEPMTGGDGRREKSQGLGLGLYITKQIVRAHGGTIDVHSSDAGETAFRVVLPRVAERTRV